MTLYWQTDWVSLTLGIISPGLIDTLFYFQTRLDFEMEVGGKG